MFCLSPPQRSWQPSLLDLTHQLARCAWTFLCSAFAASKEAGFDLEPPATHRHGVRTFALDIILEDKELTTGESRS
jgi:hypothetical protein